jgi:transcriptional regulator GlxA family with amidase domain
MAKRLGFVLFKGFEVLDVYGPLSFFASPKLSDAYEVITIAQSAGPIAASNGVSTVATHDFSNSGDLDVLLVPGKANNHVEGAQGGHVQRHACKRVNTCMALARASFDKVPSTCM